MPKILKIKNANDYSRYVGLKDKHPLVSVVEYADVSPVRSSLNNYEVYALFMLRYIDVELKYGCGKYDYRGGTLFLPIRLPNYFSDLVRKTINDTASNYIRQYIIFAPDEEVVCPRRENGVSASRLLLG